MALKDYYKILGISPAASADEVKKAYRRLALRHHPDKNSGSHIAHLHFEEIREAYDTLIDKNKREAYNYERFYHFRYLRQKPMQSAVTAEWIVQQAAAFKATLEEQDFFRVNHDGVLYQVQQILSDYNLEILAHSDNRAAIESIIANLLWCTRPLNFAYTAAVCRLLFTLAGSDAGLAAPITGELKRKKQQQALNRYKLPAVLLLVLLLLLLIILVNR